MIMLVRCIASGVAVLGLSACFGDRTGREDGNRIPPHAAESPANGSASDALGRPNDASRDADQEVGPGMVIFDTNPPAGPPSAAPPVVHDHLAP